MTSHPRGNRDLIRAINRSAVLNTIKQLGPLSRTEIARRTRLSAATITGIAGELIHRNLIFEKEAGDSRGGRRPILLALNPRGGYVIGLKLAEELLTGALTDLEATVLAKDARPLPDNTPAAAVDAIAALVKALLAEIGIHKEQLLGVGVGLAGIVQARSGILRHSPISGWRDVPLAGMLAARLEVPIFIENDVNTLTITEQWFGQGQGVENFLTITVGRGIGLGIVLNGRLYQGAQGGAGEFGHTVIDPQGPLCDCGKRGCLEKYAADPALLALAGQAHRRGELSAAPVTVLDLLKLAESGDPGARSIYARAGAALGQGVANLINVLNPELIIISGEGVRAGDFLFTPMRAALAAHVMPGLAGDTLIRIDAWDDGAWARGAAGLVLRQIFESPYYQEIS
jgi:predicted NBD/HSP70 family sugar kinase